MRGSAITLSQLANLLSPRVERAVEDRTGLVGFFDVDLQWTPEQRTFDAPSPGLPALTATDPNAVSLFTALQEQLGLKLESIKGSLDALVIDRVEKPAENK